MRRLENDPVVTDECPHTFCTGRLNSLRLSLHMEKSKTDRQIVRENPKRIEGGEEEEESWAARGIGETVRQSFQFKSSFVL
mmetsp:Transcript_33835/g.67029  ORF Transcript_33835/g.67029 Transcript_33835/m.67029 type:complete len:81 (+) Transcript_33835:1244-1486(+)